MKISKSTLDNTNLIIYMGDVYDNLIGKRVDILTDCQSTLTGILVAHNGYILQLFNHATKFNTYIYIHKVIAILSEE